MCPVDQFGSAEASHRCNSRKCECKATKFESALPASTSTTALALWPMRLLLEVARMLRSCLMEDRASEAALLKDVMINIGSLIYIKGSSLVRLFRASSTTQALIVSLPSFFSKWRATS